MNRSSRWSDGSRTGLRALAVVTALGFLSPALGCAAPPARDRLAPGVHDLSIETAAGTRTYLVEVPEAARRGTPIPLVIAFHGGGGQARGFRERAGLDAVADREGFVVAYPDGSGRLGRRLLTWNAGGCCGLAMRRGIDDVAFVRAMVEDIARRTSIDRRRIYATGHSNGAMMAYRLAAEAPDLVAAIAPVGGAMILDAFVTHEPIPVMHIHSVDDPRALYAGGLGPPFPLTRSRVRHHAVETELARWIALNGCAPEPTLVEERVDAEQGHTAEHLRFAPCRSGATVELWKLRGPGHAWPGGDGAGRERLIGPPTRVISAAEEVWRFLSQFAKDAGR